MSEMNQNGTTKNFCSNCGAKLEGIVHFCSVCGAPQEVVSQSAPAPEQPVVECAPVTPVAVAEPVSRNRFPIASLIFASIATIYYLFTLFSNNYFAVDPIRNILYFLPYPMMILGLCFGRGSKNVLFGIAFLVMGGMELLFWLCDVFGYGYYNGVDLTMNIFFYLPQLIFIALIGIPYLTGSAKGTKNSFAIWAIILDFHILIFNCIRYQSFYGLPTEFIANLVQSSLLLTLPTMLAVLTYTPFREKQ